MLNIEIPWRNLAQHTDTYMYLHFFFANSADRIEGDRSLESSDTDKLVWARTAM